MAEGGPMDYQRLDPDAIIGALEDQGLSCSGHIQQLNSLENRVFDLGLEDGSHVVVKFYRPERWSEAAILEEHRFLFILHEAEVPVCLPLTRDGRSLFERQGLFYAVWPRTGGRLIDEFTTELIERLGSYIARIHLVGKSLEFSHRPIMNESYMVIRHREYLLEQNLLPPEIRRSYLEASFLLEKLASDLLPSLGSSAIHGDCHTGNILNDGSRLFFLDFDDAVRGPAVQDMWMIVSDAPGRQEEKIQAFVRGYERFLPLPPGNIEALELMRALRYLAYNGWIARRRDDEGIRRAFPDFGSRDYWDGFIRDIHDQLDFIQENSVRQAAEDSGPAEGSGQEPQLSDEDYFFDLDEGRWSPGE